VEIMHDRPWFNWYTWRLEYWGTKWGAYDGYTIQENRSLLFIFSTAWSVSEPIINRLRILGYDFTVLFADEDWGSNCGKYEYNSHTGELFSWYEHEHCEDTVAFAKRIWDKY
jgi:hypothetical protein